MVDAAADWCSAEPRCRGFTISAEVHDDRLIFVRFSATAGHVLSGEWMSYLKEPAERHAYSFSPGYLLAPGEELHEEWASLLLEEASNPSDAALLLLAQPVLGFTAIEAKKEGKKKRTEHKLWPTSSIELAIGCATRP